VGFPAWLLRGSTRARRALVFALGAGARVRVSRRVVDGAPRWPAARSGRSLSFRIVA